jgi:hypothetical protein
LAAHDFQQVERDIVEPEDGYCPKMPGTNIWHQVNTFSIGVRTNPYLRPTDVSFKWIEYKQGFCWAQVSGWFTHKFSGTHHSAWTAWLPVGGGNATTGCPVLIAYDDASLWDYFP